MARLPQGVQFGLPIVLVCVLLVATACAHAQGCAQCADNAAATPAATQAAYRHAILLLIAFASALFLAGVALLRRNP